jgi:oleate hydratase
MTEPKYYFIGAGVASFSGALYLLKDAKVSGKNIFIIEQSKAYGGALEATNDPNQYVSPGSRLFAKNEYTCTFDLLDTVPSIDDPNISIKKSIYDFNDANPVDISGRLLETGGVVVDSTQSQLSMYCRLLLATIIFVPERLLQKKKIDDYFPASFFKTNFWCMFRGIFAFKEYHSLLEFQRYMIRFLGQFPTLNTLSNACRNKMNQYEEIILPMYNKLNANVVNFISETVQDIQFNTDFSRVERIQCQNANIILGSQDNLFITLGSIITASAFGSNTEPAQTLDFNSSASWNLWFNLYKKNNQIFGNPYNFCSDLHKTKFISFSMTVKTDILLKYRHNLIKGKESGYLISTIKNSGWFLTIDMYQFPQFLNEPAGTYFVWGYGLYPDNIGNFIKKPMTACNGNEIMLELFNHLGMPTTMIDDVMSKSVCVPYMLPYITSQFMPRSTSDRPKVVPDVAKNYAFMGQYCEIPKDCVFLVDSSVRSAQIATYTLAKVPLALTPVYDYFTDIKVLWNAAKTLLYK